MPSTVILAQIGLIFRRFVPKGPRKRVWHARAGIARIDEPARTRGHSRSFGQPMENDPEDDNLTGRLEA